MNLTFDLSKEGYETAKEKGFHPDNIIASVGQCRDFPYMATRIALIHSEASEALEELRNTPFDLGNFSDELADILIRVGDLAWLAGVDLEGAVSKKMAYNKTRQHRHGGRTL